MKNKTKPTYAPGPWVPIDTARVGRGLDSIIIGAGKDQKYVAEAYGATREIKIANSMLICAAPDMLEALKLVYGALPPDQVYNEERKAIKIAIEKAEGR